MRKNVELYVNGNKIELWDFEDINIVDQIQDVRDINKIFVPYSREFTVPASKENNKVFKHYYNENITNGFDARYKITGELRINGIPYKQGKVVLLGATLKNDVAHSYKLIFYDRTVDLKALIGDDMLSDLQTTGLSEYKFDYNYTNVFSGFTNGWTLSGGTMNDTYSASTPSDLIFPFISTNNHYFYDSDNNGISPIENDVESRNLNTTAPTDTTINPDLIYGVEYKDLRGAIRVPIIFDAIQDKYEGITFTGDFISESNDVFNKLYLFLQKEKGLYEAGNSYEFLLSDATESSTPSILPLATSGSQGDPFYIYYAIEATVEPDEPNDDFNFKVLNLENDSIVYKGEGKGDTTFEFELWSTSSTNQFDLKIVTSEFSSANIDFSIVVQKRQIVAFATDSYTTRTFTESGTAVSEYQVYNNMPKIKVLDFLTGIFNMFNLTAYTNDDGEIVIQPLDEYYLQGNTIDITRFVDSSNKEVTRNKLFSEINFKYEEPSTFAVLNSNEITGDTFGNEVIEDVNNDQYLRDLLAFDGGTYDIKPKFEKIMYERMTDQTGGAVTDFGWGWLVDKDARTTLPKPILFYAERMDISASTPSSIALDYYTGHISTSAYYRPSNSLTTDTEHGQSLNFGSEFDEFYYDLDDNPNSLFKTYWYNYILGVYDKQSRIVSVTAYLPSTIITNIRLNDEIILQNNRYFINKIDANITTGKTKLELLTKWDIE